MSVTLGLTPLELLVTVIITGILPPVLLRRWTNTLLTSVRCLLVVMPKCPEVPGSFRGDVSWVEQQENVWVWRLGSLVLSCSTDEDRWRCLFFTAPSLPAVRGPRNALKDYKCAVLGTNRLFTPLWPSDAPCCEVREEMRRYHTFSEPTTVRKTS